jgi:hypothetical protein
MARQDSWRTRIRRPASAAVAGIVFAVILGAVIVLLHNAAPALPSDAGKWADDEGRRDAVSTALNLIPFAGIAFLWFIAVIRAQVGPNEDRFVGTVFLGSGLVFVAMLFAAAASLKAVLLLQDGGLSPSLEIRAFAWSVGAVLLGSFGARMAAVFTASVATVALRSGAVPRWLAYSGYATALLLLFTPPLAREAQLLFPAWILVISGFLLTGRHTREPANP